MIITKQQIIDTVERNYNKQRKNLINDLNLSDTYIIDDERKYETLKTIIITESHLKNILIDTLVELLTNK